MLICGIDIGKNKHEASIIDETGRLLAKSLRFDNTTEGGEKLLDYFAGCNSEKQVIIVGIAMFSYVFNFGYVCTVAHLLSYL